MDTVKTIKGYELHERIGSGGFGIVHRATQTTVGREVAIKIILPHFANHPDFIRRFETEAQIIARLEHLHIVPLYDYWRDPDGAYLVMRWLRGGNLRDALTNGPFELETAALFMDQITSALAMAHRNDVIHRDLKPANILLDEDGNAYLSDFGIAKDAARTEGTHTETGMVLGSPDYLSPEQARSEPVTPQTDIYSLGVMLYEVLTGEHPFPNLSSVERLYKHINEPLPRIDSLSPEVADGVNAIIQKATAKNPAQRYADVLEMAADFRRETDLSQRSPESIVEQLTLREQEVLQMITEGLSNKEIAENLFVTVATVKWHIRQLYQKLHVRSRVQAIMRGRDLQLIGSDTTVEPARSESTYVALPEPENPYKGLRAFQTADARDFFGREKLVQRLIRRLDGHTISARFLAVVGPSGSGKSSVVKAGLIPALWRGDLPGSERWFIVEMIPGAHPLDELEIGLTRVAADQSGNLREQLERDSRGLVRVAGLLLPDDGSELVVIVDQFEEIFTLVDNETRRIQFLDLLYAAATDPRSRVRVIVTLRADFYDRPLHYPQFGELVRTRMETVMPLSADELEAAIDRPAARVGVSFEPGLVATITGDVHYQPGALPLLQYALTELFEQRANRTLTHDAYQALGGAAGALTRRAEELFHEQDAAGQEHIRQMFLRLVTLGEGVEDTRRRVPRSELLAVGGNDDLMDEIIDTYAAYRLLTLDHDPASRRPTVEIAHEAILREWERLRTWLNESRHDIQQQQLLGAAAEAWRQGNHDKSYLLHGTRLTQLEEWAASTELALTQRERDFLDACIAERERQVATEHERQQRELDTQRQLLEQQRRATNRLRYLVGGLIVFLAATLGLSFFAFGRQREADNARRASDTNAARARELALVNGAQASFAQGDLDTALALAFTANQTEQPSAQAKMILSQAAYTPGTMRQFTIHNQPIIELSLAPDGRTALSATWGDGVTLWDVETGAILHRLSDFQDGWNVAHFSPDGEYVMSGSGNTDNTGGEEVTLSLWDVKTGSLIRHFEDDRILPNGAVFLGGFSPDGRWYLASNGGGFDASEAALIIWDVSTGQVDRSLTGYDYGINGAAFSPDGQMILSVMSNQVLTLADAETGEIIQQFGESQDPATTGWHQDILFGSDGRTALTARSDGLMTRWDLETYQEIRRFEIGSNIFKGYANLSADGRTVAVASTDMGITLWDVYTGQLLGTWLAPTTSVALRPDGHTVLAGTASGDIRLVDLRHGAVSHRIALIDKQPVLGVFDVSPDGTMFATGVDLDVETETYQIALFDVLTGVEIRRLGPDGLTPEDARFSPDGQRVVATYTGSLTPGWAGVWDVKTGQEIGHLESEIALAEVAFSPDGIFVLLGEKSGSSGQAILWDFTSNQVVFRLDGHTRMINGFAFSPDGQTVLTAGQDGLVILWDVTTGQEIHRFFHESATNAVDVSPDGHTIITAADDGVIRLWDLATGVELRQFLGQTTTSANDARFSPDGRIIFANHTRPGSEVIQWDVATGSAIRRYPVGAPWNIALSPDGRSLFVPTDQDSALYMFRIDTVAELLDWTQHNRYIRDLTCEEHALYQMDPLCE